MSYSINGQNVKELLATKKENIVLPKNSGVIKSNALSLSDDVAIFKSHFDIKKDLQIHHEKTFYDKIAITFAVNGKIQTKIHEVKNPVSLCKNEKIILLIKDYSSSINLKKDSTFSAINIEISKNFLKKYLPNLAEFDHTQMLKQTQSNPKKALIASEIFHSSFDEKLNEIYIQGKVFELIFLEFSNLNEFKEENKIIFSNHDIKALQKAKEILTSKMQNTPSISELARLVALNEFKLKFGFKKYFCITPYQYLFAHKMNEAKKLLESGDYNVEEVSKKVGYKRIQSFSTAFYRHFGINAKTLKGKKFYM